MAHRNDEAWLASKGLRVTLMAAFGLAFVGFFVGVRQAPTYVVASPSGTDVVDMTVATPAPSNRELSVTGFTPSERWRPDPVTHGAPIPPTNPSAKASALARRNETRAFDGAPPTVPHPVGQGSALECLACHADGARVGTRVAPKMSHAHQTACTQCHVPAGSPIPTLSDRGDYGLLDPGTTFTPLRPAGGAYRWAVGSPPQMPHPSTMREDCNSCHGPGGTPGLQTTHPERAACTQCHTASAALDQEL